jgi:hypothetical protein
MAATAPKMSASGLLPSAEAAPVLSGMPAEPVAEPVGLPERVALEKVPFTEALKETEADG